jgi:hypothetical protein
MPLQFTYLKSCHYNPFIVWNMPPYTFFMLLDPHADQPIFILPKMPLSLSFSHITDVWAPLSSSSSPPVAGSSLHAAKLAWAPWSRRSPPAAQPALCPHYSRQCSCLHRSSQSPSTMQPHDSRRHCRAPPCQRAAPQPLTPCHRHRDSCSRA